MKKIKRYQNASVYFAENQSYLIQSEINNNLILGLVKFYENVAEIPEQVILLTVFDELEPRLTFFKNSKKGVLAGNNAQKEDYLLLIEYLQNQEIILEGTVGDEIYTHTFAELYPRKIITHKKLISHELSEVNNIHISEGMARLAIDTEVALLAQWFFYFQEEEQLFPKKNIEEYVKSTEDLILKKKLYVWEKENQIMSMAAIVRETDNFQIIGAVYTPTNERKKGYASSLVHFLSQVILDNGKKAGLFTAASNPTSNKIYNLIGYESAGIVGDYEFGEQ